MKSRLRMSCYAVNFLFDFGDEIGNGTYFPSVSIGEAEPDSSCKKELMAIKKKFRLFGR